MNGLKQALKCEFIEIERKVKPSNTDLFAASLLLLEWDGFLHELCATHWCAIHVSDRRRRRRARVE